jgi:type I restriction enzyme R subunit
MYRLLRAAYESVFVDRELTRKTAKLVQQHTYSGTIQDTLEVYEINENLLELLARDDTPDTVKIFNLLKSIQEMVTSEASQAPYLISIGERAEAIVQAYQLRQEATQEALEALEELIEEINKAEKEREQMDMLPASFAVYWLLNREGISEAEPIARNMETTFEEFPHWQYSDAQERDVRRALWGVLLTEKSKSKSGRQTTEEIDEMKILVDQIMNIAGRTGNGE